MLNLRHFIILLCLFFLAGCATLMESTPGFAHTAALMVGQSKAEVFSQLKNVGLFPTGEVDMSQVNMKRFEHTTGYGGAFSEAESFIVMFDGDELQEFFTQPKGSSGLNISDDYGVIRGYLLVRKGSEVSVKKLK